MKAFILTLMMFHFGTEGFAAEKAPRKPSQAKTQACSASHTNAERMCTALIGRIPTAPAEARLLILELVRGNQSENSQVLLEQRNLAESCGAAVERCRKECLGQPLAQDCSKPGRLGRAQQHFQQAVIDLESYLKNGEPVATDSLDVRQSYISSTSRVVSDRPMPGLSLDLSPDLEITSVKVKVVIPLPPVPASRPLQSAGAQ